MTDDVPNSLGTLYGRAECDLKFIMATSERSNRQDNIKVGKSNTQIKLVFSSGNEGEFSIERLMRYPCLYMRACARRRACDGERTVHVSAEVRLPDVVRMMDGKAHVFM
jgi:hypothetical protein